MEYCAVCGSPIPDGQDICSACCKDLGSEDNNYYRQYMGDWGQYFSEQEMKEAEEEEMQREIKDIMDTLKEEFQNDGELEEGLR